jgi:RHH-type rel operon transcriptional repressor/antitoxin RelB
MATNLTVRLDAMTKKSLDQLAKATGRTRSFLAQDALRRYVEEQAWQVAEIRKGVKEADAGDFATKEEVTATLNKWGVRAR